MSVVHKCDLCDSEIKQIYHIKVECENLQDKNMFSSNKVLQIPELDLCENCLNKIIETVSNESKNSIQEIKPKCFVEEAGFSTGVYCRKKCNFRKECAVSTYVEINNPYLERS